jgi:nitrogenase molybdenum-iron protein beta chain
MVKSFSTKSATKKNHVNIIAGWMEPSDMREIKRLAAEMTAKIVLFPDTSDVVDTPMTGKFEMYPKGGTTVPELVSTGDSKKTIALGPYCTQDAAIALENKCRVKFEMLEIPIGLKATDNFITALSRAAGVAVPDSITDDRGRLLDLITDMHKYLYGKRVALWGDPDTLVPLVEFLLTLDMKPVYIVTGTPGKAFEEKMTEMLLPVVPEAKFKAGERADMFLMHQWIKQQGVDLLIGNTYGKYIARDENTPFVRHGFPIVDRFGHSYYPSVGYAGATYLVTQMLSAIMDHEDRTCPEYKMELVM